MQRRGAGSGGGLPMQAEKHMQKHCYFRDKLFTSASRVKSL